MAQVTSAKVAATLSDAAIKSRMDAMRKDDSVNHERSGPYEVFTVTSATIRTIEKLLDAIGVSRGALDRNGDSEWLVERYSANKWDQGVVLGKAHRVVELWQIKAYIRRRKLIPTEFAPLRPLQVHMKTALSRCPKTVKRKAMCRAVVIPDTQHGFSRGFRGDLDPLHDRQAVDITVQLVQHLSPDVVVLLGDHLDLPDWSDKFVHGPEFALTTQPSAIELRYDLERIRRAAPGAEIIYLEGNHEERLVRAQKRNMISAVGLRPTTELDVSVPLLSVERLLDLQGLRIKFLGDYPNGEFWLNDNLRCFHGWQARGESGDTARQILRDARHSSIYGHVHRQELLSKTVHPRRGAVTYMAHCPGTLARIDGAVPAATPRVNWQQGVSVVHFEPGNGLFNIEPVSIYGGRAVYHDRLFTGAFSADKLRVETGWREF